MRRPGWRPRGVVSGAALLASAAVLAADPPATYRLEGTAQVSAPPAPDRAVEVHADATLRTRGLGERAITIGAAGATCEVLAHADADGALRLDAAQRCAIDLRSPDARGHLDVVLRSGTGRV